MNYKRESSYVLQLLSILIQSFSKRNILLAPDDKFDCNNIKFLTICINKIQCTAASITNPFMLQFHVILLRRIFIVGLSIVFSIVLLSPGGFQDHLMTHLLKPHLLHELISTINQNKIIAAFVLNPSIDRRANCLRAYIFTALQKLHQHWRRIASSIQNTCRLSTCLRPTVAPCTLPYSNQQQSPKQLPLKTAPKDPTASRLSQLFFIFKVHFCWLPMRTYIGRIHIHFKLISLW